MKKLTAIFLTALILITTLTACSGENNATLDSNQFGNSDIITNYLTPMHQGRIALLNGSAEILTPDMLAIFYYMNHKDAIINSNSFLVSLDTCTAYLSSWFVSAADILKKSTYYNSVDNTLNFHQCIDLDSTRSSVELTSFEQSNEKLEIIYTITSLIGDDEKPISKKLSFLYNGEIYVFDNVSDFVS